MVPPQAAACSSCVGGVVKHITSKSYNIEHWHDKACSRLSVNCISVPWGGVHAEPVVCLSTGAVFIPPVQLLGGARLYIPEKKQHVSCLQLHGNMETVEILHTEVIWDLESMVTIQAAQKQNGRIYMLRWCKMHISPYALCFYSVKCTWVDWVTHFTQLRKKPCNDHRGYPFLKVCTCTPENLTSKVGHRVLKNFFIWQTAGGGVMKDVADDMPVRVRALLAVWNSVHARVQKFWYVTHISAVCYEDAPSKQMKTVLRQ